MGFFKIYKKLKIPNQILLKTDQLLMNYIFLSLKIKTIIVSIIIINKKMVIDLIIFILLINIIGKLTII